MASDRFRNFLSTVEGKLFPDAGTEVLSPESPPNWTRLGWKAGFIVEEGHTGLQWWLTEDVRWSSLTESFGSSARQKKQAFAKWYGGLLDELTEELGVPLNLESLKQRKMDLAAFEGRPLIEEEDWWHVRIGSEETGYWSLIVSQRFLRIFDEESEASRGPESPWDFLELWGRLDDRCRRDLLRTAGDDRGLLNHLASLVVSGNLELEGLVELMPRQPREDFEVIVDRRRSTLDGSSTAKRNQTLDRWREDAVVHLTERVGEWLEEGELPTTRWKTYAGEWNRYRREVLEETFEDEKWVDLFRRLSDRDLKQIGPRLDLEMLRDSLAGLSRGRRETVHETLPDSLAGKLRDNKPSDLDQRDVLESRENLFEQGREIVTSIDYRLDGNWSLKPDDD